MIGLSGNREAAAFLKKSGAENFCLAGPAAAKPARPKLTEVFLLLFVHNQKPSSHALKIATF
jgi:hypothetical protein